MLVNISNRFSSKQCFMYIILGICFIGSIYFVHHNYDFYERPIAKIIDVKLEETTGIIDIHNNQDLLYVQSILAELKNGEKKDRIIHLTNTYSLSKTYNQEYQVGNDIFVWIDASTIETEYLSGSIIDFKRDKQLLMVAWIFIFVLLVVGKKQGFFSIVSLVVNAILLSYSLDIYLNTSNISLVLICGLAVIFFTIISFLLVNGFNEKAYAAIIATLIGTFLLLLITYVVMVLTSHKGLLYEEMAFITRPHQAVFLAGVLIGSLGAVMDVAITMSSSIFNLFEHDYHVSIDVLKLAGNEIGKDIMGTMTNILFFAYLSGSIPMLILYFKNASPLGFALSMNLSLEVARALAGGIGIVLTIPIGLYTAIFFVNRKRARL